MGAFFLESHSFSRVEYVNMQKAAKSKFVLSGGLFSIRAPTRGAIYMMQSFISVAALFVFVSFNPRDFGEPR